MLGTEVGVLCPLPYTIRVEDSLKIDSCLTTFVRHGATLDQYNEVLPFEPTIADISRMAALSDLQSLTSPEGRKERYLKIV